MEIKQVMKQRRLERGYTQEQVAEKIFVSAKSISNWETGKNFPDIESLVRLTKLYGLSLDNLLLEDSEIVQDIKKKSELDNLRRWSFWGPQLTNGLVFLLLFVSTIMKETYSVTTYLIIALITISNIVSIAYFTKAMNKIDPIQKKDLVINKKFLLILFIILLLVIFLPVISYVFLKKS